MNILDALILLPVSWGAYKGFKKGFIFEVAMMMAIILGLMGGFKFADLASEYLSAAFNIKSSLLPFMSFLTVFILIIISTILFAKMLEGAIKIAAMGPVNKIMGLLLGITKWVVVVGTAIFFFAPFDIKFDILSEEKKNGSLLYNHTREFAQTLVPTVEGIKETALLKINSP
jgi:membrane protein required for colicin V production